MDPLLTLVVLVLGVPMFGVLIWAVGKIAGGAARMRRSRDLLIEIDDPRAQRAMAARRAKRMLEEQQAREAARQEALARAWETVDRVVLRVNQELQAVVRRAERDGIGDAGYAARLNAVLVDSLAVLERAATCRPRIPTSAATDTVQRLRLMRDHERLVGALAALATVELFVERVRNAFDLPPESRRDSLPSLTDLDHLERAVTGARDEIAELWEQYPAPKDEEPGLDPTDPSVAWESRLVEVDGITWTERTAQVVTGPDAGFEAHFMLRPGIVFAAWVSDQRKPSADRQPPEAVLARLIGLVLQQVKRSGWRRPEIFVEEYDGLDESSRGRLGWDLRRFGFRRISSDELLSEKFKIHDAARWFATKNDFLAACTRAEPPGPRP